MGSTSARAEPSRAAPARMEENFMVNSLSQGINWSGCLVDRLSVLLHSSIVVVEKGGRRQRLHQADNERLEASKECIEEETRDS